MNFEKIIEEIEGIIEELRDITIDKNYHKIDSIANELDAIPGRIRNEIGDPTAIAIRAIPNNGQLDFQKAKELEELILDFNKKNHYTPTIIL